jgi:hypothetical protein
VRKKFGSFAHAGAMVRTYGSFERIMNIMNKIEQIHMQLRSKENLQENKFMLTTVIMKATRLTATYHLSKRTP